MSKKIRIILGLLLLFNAFWIMLFGVMAIKNLSPAGFLNRVVATFQKQENKIASYYVEKVDQFDNYKIGADDTVFVGDSITDMGEWVEIFNNIHVKNRGINGDSILGVLNRIESIAKGKPKNIFLMIGTNDLVNNPDVSLLAENYSKIITKIKSVSPDTQIYIQSVLPINSRGWKTDPNTLLNNRIQDNSTIKEFNKKLDEIATQDGVKYINLFSEFTDSVGDLNMDYSDEGLHLNGKGYMIWKETIKEYVN